MQILSAFNFNGVNPVTGYINSFLLPHSEFSLSVAQHIDLSDVQRMSLKKIEQSSFDMIHVPKDHERRRDTEQYVEQVFLEQHQAQITEFMPHLLMHQQGQEIKAAVGFRFAKNERLFVENYIDQSIESLLRQIHSGKQPMRSIIATAKAIGKTKKIERQDIVEVGNLCCTRMGFCALIFQTLCFLFDKLGVKWVVFTGTETVRKNFNRLGIPTTAIAQADKARLGANQAQWGSYYEKNPLVMVCSVADFLKNTNPSLSLEIN